MAAKSMSASARGAVPKHAAPPPPTRARRLDTAPGSWERAGQDSDGSDADFDCQRIVQGDGGRSVRLYYDDYN